VQGEEAEAQNGLCAGPARGVVWEKGLGVLRDLDKCIVLRNIDQAGIVKRGQEHRWENKLGKGDSVARDLCLGGSIERGG